MRIYGGVKEVLKLANLFTFGRSLIGSHLLLPVELSSCLRGFMDHLPSSTRWELLHTSWIWIYLLSPDSTQCFMYLNSNSSWDLLPL